MPSDRDLLQQALDALCQSSIPKYGYRRNELFLQPKPHIELYQEAIEALRARLAQPEPELVAWVQPDHLQKAAKAPFLCRVEPTQRFPDFVPIYTTPPQRTEWRGLTDEEVDDLAREMVKGDKSVNWLARAIEAKLKGKNT